MEEPRVTFYRSSAELEPDCHVAIKFLWGEMQRQKMSQRILAYRSDVSDSLLRKWRQGDRAPKLDDVERCLNVLGYRLHIQAIPGIPMVHEENVPWVGTHNWQNLKKRVIEAMDKLGTAYMKEIVEEVYGYKVVKSANRTSDYKRLSKVLRHLKDEGYVNGPVQKGSLVFWQRLYGRHG